MLASFKEVLIAGDVGPLGIPLAPFGRVQPEDARRAFREQIEALLKADVDLLVIETITDLYEMREALSAARELSSDIPIVASMTFTRDDRTLLGDSPRKVARNLAEFGSDVIGINCSGGPNQLLRILREMQHTHPRWEILGQTETPVGRNRTAGAFFIPPQRITSAITPFHSGAREPA